MQYNTVSDVASYFREQLGGSPHLLPHYLYLANLRHLVVYNQPLFGWAEDLAFAVVHTPHPREVALCELDLPTLHHVPTDKPDWILTGDVLRVCEWVLDNYTTVGQVWQDTEIGFAVLHAKEEFKKRTAEGENVQEVMLVREGVMVDVLRHQQTYEYGVDTNAR